MNKANKKGDEKLVSSRKRIPIKELPISKFIPNIATMMALCTGLSGIHFAMMNKYELAVGAIMIAGVLDVLDGRLARMLGAESDFGAELDSLSDFVCFGVVPAVVTYMWSLHHWKGWGWGFCLLFVICSGWRLARFNISLKNPDKKLYGDYFIGVPAPMGALLCLFPLIVGFALGLTDPLVPIVYGLALFLSGILMVSGIPTFSTKTLTLTRKMIFPLLLAVGFLGLALLNATWETLSIVIFGYIVSIGISYFKFTAKQLSKKSDKKTS